ncbi:MAG: phosphatase PAP2 family protein [Rikenellaceae bacterium]
MWDQDLFLWLNFDGGATLDSIMIFISGKLSWLPYYALILALVGRKYGWKSALLIAVSIGAAVGISDLLAGIFKHSGPLKDLWSEFPARLRPMHNPEIQDIVHFIKKGGKFGTVSAHAATAFSIALISSLAIRKRWFTIIAFVEVALVCYSRIYLGYHYPQDILLGIGIGFISGWIMWLIFNNLNKRVAKNNAQ